MLSKRRQHKRDSTRLAWNEPFVRVGERWFLNVLFGQRTSPTLLLETIKELLARHSARNLLLLRPLADVETQKISQDLNDAMAATFAVICPTDPRRWGGRVRARKEPEGP